MKNKFTLIELLVVMAVVGILVSILLPSLSNARQEAQRALCLSNYKQVSILVELYGATNDSTFPGIVEGYHTQGVVQDNNYLPFFLKEQTGLEVGDDFPLLHCPGFTQTYSGRTNPNQSKNVRVDGLDKGRGNLRVFGRPGGIGGNSKNPVKMATVEDPSKIRTLHEIWKGNRVSDHIPVSPLHGFKGGAARMNMVYIDGSAKTGIDIYSMP